MPLSDFLGSCLWAVMPNALEPMLHAMSGIVGSGPEHHPTGAVLTSSSVQGDAVPAKDYFLRDGVAVVEVSGLIRRSGGSFLCFSWAGQDRIRSAVAAAMDDPSVRAVLLSLDSPGGIATGVKELADFIAAQTAKPIYAYADGTCCSAAYWIASATRKIYAPLSANLGSIGVLQVHCDYSAANSTAGVRYTYIVGGKWKAVGNPDTPLSTSDQAHLQELVTSIHDLFRADVAAHMPVDAADPATWGDGQVFLAAKAHEFGLINGIVADRDALIAQINKETSMDKDQLAKAHPELLAQIKTEAVVESEAAAQVALVKARENYLAMTRLVAGEDAAGRLEKLLAADFTPDQVAAFADAFGEPGASSENVSAGQNQAATAATDQEQKSRAEILAAIRQGTPPPANTSSTVADVDPVQAAIDRISNINA